MKPLLYFMPDVTSQHAHALNTQHNHWASFIKPGYEQISMNNLLEHLHKKVGIQENPVSCILMCLVFLIIWV